MEVCEGIRNKLSVKDVSNIHYTVLSRQASMSLMYSNMEKALHEEHVYTSSTLVIEMQKQTENALTAVGNSPTLI